MREPYHSHVLLTFNMLSLLLNFLAECNRVDDWGREVMGIADNLQFDDSRVSETIVNTYKNNLLRYVLQTTEPTEVKREEDVPYVMSKIYELLADRSTGRQRRSAPFEVDMIRGLEDHYGVQRRMQFYFNTSLINETEDVLESYFYVYIQTIPDHDLYEGNRSIKVSLYKVTDETKLLGGDEATVKGATLLEEQQVPLSTSQWLVFKNNLKETVREWVRHPHKNKGFLLTAVDGSNRPVSSTLIHIVQKEETPASKQPLFVIFTDQDKKKNRKHKRKHEKNIHFLMEDILNEKNQTLKPRCAELLGDSIYTSEQCVDMLLRERRSLIDPTVNIDEELLELELENERIFMRNLSQVLWFDDFTQRKPRKRHGKDLYLSANRRKSSDDICQKKPLYISFQALNWGRWIVAPEGLNANFCDGSCPFPLTSALTASNHAVLQSVSNYYYPNKIKPPCCVPQKLSRMSILYYQDESTVTMRNYDDMIVETCGCR